MSAEINYDKFKNYLEFVKQVRSVFYLGPLLQAIYVLGFTEDWQGYVSVATEGFSTPL
jgi:hypothetical protein